MHGLSPIDPGNVIDWSKTSTDYATHRPGPPPRFYQLLHALGVGLLDQHILDLGTGTGVLARQFAKQGARVSGIDIAAGQIEMAQKLADEDGASVDFRVASAESTPFADHAFDAVTANQCWLYFDKARAIPEAQRLLTDGGVLVTSHFSWLARLDPVARASEALVLKHNPAWSASDWHGNIPNVPQWVADYPGAFRVRALFWFDEAIPFTRDSWRGRMRACRGVGAALEPEAVQAFDEEHAALLERIAPEKFTVLHRLDAHLFEPI